MVASFEEGERGMTEEIPEGYKRCYVCGEIKPVGVFSKNRSERDGLQYYCKICAREINKKYREENKENVLERRKKYYKENKERELERMKKYNRCVKKTSCPAVGGKGAEFVILTCPICGKEFRKLKSYVDNVYERRGQTHFYCSRECHNESMRKSHTTEYEKNIKRIRKEQRL